MLEYRRGCLFLFFLCCFTIHVSREYDNVQGFVADEQDLLKRYPQQNTKFVQQIGGEHWFVQAVQIRDRSRLEWIDTLMHHVSNGSYHHESATFALRHYDQQQQALNRVLLPPGAVYKFYAPMNATGSALSMTEIPSERIENCFYQGKIGGEQNLNSSFVALSTCDGLSGLIYSQNSTRLIKPFVVADETERDSKRRPHVLFTVFDRNARRQCGNTDVTEWDVALSRRQEYHRKRLDERDVSTETKYIELRLLVDQNVLQQDSHRNVSLHDVAPVFEALNIVDVIYHSLSTRISLVRLEVWSAGTRGPIDYGVGILESLLNLQQYITRGVERADVTVLLTKKRFAHSMMGRGGSACSANAAGIVSLTKKLNFDTQRIAETAGLIAHTIGHVLGLKHHDLTAGRICDCGGSTSSCVMQTPPASAEVNDLPVLFSSCSHADYLDALRSGQLKCLFNEPLQFDAISALCGNNLLDAGEQCDCGSAEECHDSCCDANTCKLRVGAQCSAADSCCENCLTKRSGVLCRAALDDCDVPEFCNGQSGKCPPDARIPNGFSCADKTGWCFDGRCASPPRQCERLWGVGASNAAHECYDRLNRLGGSTGHCGKAAASGGFLACSASDVRCGLLHCRGGRDSPVLSGFDGEYFKTEIQNMFECKVAYSGSVGLVENGSKCAENSVCVDAKCVPLETVVGVVTANEPGNCPTNNLALPCSGRGICTTLNTCFCNAGWTGLDCAARDEDYTSAPTPSGSDPDARHGSTNRTVGESGVGLFGGLGWLFDNTFSLLVILGGVAGIVFVFVCLVVCCYRRRSSSMQKRDALTAAERKMTNGGGSAGYTQSENGSENASGRVITFGRMPSYRDDKMKNGGSRSRASLTKIREQDERSASSQHSVEQRQPLLTAEPQQRSPAKSTGILKQQPHSARSCYSDVNGPTSGAQLGRPPWSSTQMARKFGARADGYESDTYASNVIYQRHARHHRGEGRSGWQTEGEIGDDEVVFDLNNSSFEEAQVVAALSARKRAQATNGNEYELASAGHSLRSATARSQNTSRRSQPGTPTAPRSIERRGTNVLSNWPQKQQQFASRLIPDDQNATEAVADGAEGGGLEESIEYPPNFFTVSPASKQAAARQASPYGFLRRPQPLQLRNIDFLLKQLSSASDEERHPMSILLPPSGGSRRDDVSPVSSTGGWSMPEADKQFATLECGSNTESQATAGDGVTDGGWTVPVAGALPRTAVQNGGTPNSTMAQPHYTTPESAQTSWRDAPESGEFGAAEDIYGGSGEIQYRISAGGRQVPTRRIAQTVKPCGDGLGLIQEGVASQFARFNGAASEPQASAFMEMLMAARKTQPTKTCFPPPPTVAPPPPMTGRQPAAAEFSLNSIILDDETADCIAAASAAAESLYNRTMSCDGSDEQLNDSANFDDYGGAEGVNSLATKAAGGQLRRE